MLAHDSVVGLEAASLSWSERRKPQSSRFQLHSQNARDNKLTAEIGLRYLSLLSNIAIVHVGYLG